jgi:hypothetical protein
MPSVSELLAKRAESGSDRESTWVPATLEVDKETGDYLVRFSSKVSESDLKVSSTGKSLVLVNRVDLGRQRTPLVVRRADGTEVVMEFGSFNFPLTVK